MGGRRGRLEPFEECTCQLKDYEMYLKLYYDKKIKPLVEEVENELGSVELSRGGELNLRKRIVRDLYEGEDEDIKELVIAKLKESAKVMEDQKNDDVDHACTVSSVRLDVMSVVYKNSHQPSSIKDMPGILGQCLDGLHAGSRWTYLVVMGGPHPLSNEIGRASCRERV